MRLTRKLLLALTALALVASPLILPAPPVYAASFSQTISDNTNSVHERSDNGDVVDGATEVSWLSNVGGLSTHVGLRFTGVTVPQGSLITGAVLNVDPNSTSVDDAIGSIYLEDVDDSAAFNIGAGTLDVSGRTRTTTFTQWGEFGLGAAAVDSADFSGAVQELVNRAGWASGNDLTIIMVPLPNEARSLTFTPAAITLTIDYETANPAPLSTMSIAVVQAAAPVVPGVQDITKADFGTPQAAIILGNYGLVAGTIADNGSFAYGAYAVGTDSYFSWTNTSRSLNGSVGADAIKVGMVGEGIEFLNSTTTAKDGRAHVVMVENGVRLTWREAPSAAYLITVILFRGFENVAAGSTAIAGGGAGTTTDITVGFDPDILFTGHINAQGINDPTLEIIASNGFVVRESGGTDQAAIGYFSLDPSNPTLTSGVVHNTSGILSSPGAAASGVVRDASGAFIANGVRATRNDAEAGTSTIGWLALELPTGAAVALDILDTPTSAGQQAYTAPGIEPLAVLAFSHWQDAADATVDNDYNAWGISAFTAAEQGAITMSDQNNLANAVTKSLTTATALANLQPDGTLGYQASFVSMDAQGFTLDFTTADATARKFVALSLSAPAAAGGAAGQSDEFDAERLLYSTVMVVVIVAVSIFIPLGLMSYAGYSITHERGNYSDNMRMLLFGAGLLIIMLLSLETILSAAGL